MKKIFLMAIAAACSFMHVSGQVVTVTGATGTAGPYTTLTAAFVDINATAQTGNTISITVSGTTAEPVAGAALNAGAWTSISITPTGGAAATITGAVTAGSPLINLNGADNVTVDGLNTGGNSLTISNTTASATSGTSTIRFIGGATNNIITNCTILGSSSSSVATNGGTIFFSTDAVTTSGNDNNTISNNNIGPAGANLPSKAILGNGSTTSTPIGNSGIVINNNNIYDYFGAAVTGAGIATNGGCNNWSITNNRFYQTAPRTWTTGALHTAINIQNTTAISGAQGFTITGNIVGYASNTQTGVYTLTGAGTAAKFVGILYNGITLGSVTNINNNTVASVSMTGVSGSGVTSASPFTGILAQAGVVVTNGNTIGSQSATGSLVYSATTTTATDVYGILNFGADAWTCNTNNIGGISVTNLGASGNFLIYGIRANTGTAVTWTAGNNAVGGTVANSIQLTATGTASQVIGMASSFPASSLSNNTIRNLTSNIGAGTTTSASVIGIAITNATPSHSILQNQIYNLSNTNTTAASVVTGLQFTGGAANTVAGNRIYGLTVATNSTAGEVNGIRIAGGTTSYRNNMIAVGAGINNAIGTGSTTGGINGIFESAGTNNIYHNSVYIGGSPTAGAGPSYAFASIQLIVTRANRDNIFFNARSNSGATGKNYIIRVAGSAANPAGLTINNNLYFANGTGSVFGFFNSLDVAGIAAWRTVVGQDASSFELDPQYIDPTNSTPDLHINPAVISPAEANGADVGVTDDYDGQTRSGLTPVDIGADAGNFMGVDLAPPLIVYTPFNNTSNLANRSLSATITDNISGVPVSGIGLPVIYYRKGASDPYVSTQATSAGAGIYNFTIDYSLVTGGSVSIGDVIQYYVLAQDGAATPNVAGNPSTGASGYTANPPAVSTPTTIPNSYQISPAIGGIKTVCASGCDYTTLTGATGAFNAINTSAVTSNIELQIAGDLTAGEDGSRGLNILTDDPAGSNFTLKIYPTGTARTISGSFNGALIRTNGASRITIDGSIGGTGTDRSLTITNTSVTTPSVVLFGSVGTTPITNNTLKNCVIVNGVNTGYAIVISDATTLASAGYFSNITIRNNDIQKAFLGVFASGGTIPQNGSNLTYSQNNINTSGVNAIRNVGLYMQGVNGATVSNNTVGNMDKTNDETDYGIWLATGTINATVSNNTVSSIGYTGAAGFAAHGIYMSSGTSLTNNMISDNSVSNISSNGGATGSIATGIFISGSSGDLTIQRNKIQGIINTSTGTFPAYGIDLSGGNNITVKNNFVSNVTGDMSGGSAFSTQFGIFGIRVNAGTGHKIYHNSVNLYGARAGTATTALLTAALAIVNATSTGVDVRNNIFANNITGGTTSVANVAVYLPAGASSAMNLTWNNNTYYNGTDAARQGVGQAGTTAGTNFFTTLASQTAYTATLSPAGTNDNASTASTAAVPFLTANDLHLAPSASCATVGKGANLPSVPTDIDGNSRNTLPFIGAHEAYEPSTAATTLAGVAAPAATNPAVRTYNVSGTTDYMLDCNLITTITPGTVGGLITSSVSVDSGATKLGTSTLYLARNYDITPAVNPGSSGATVVLYFLQSEFDNFNTKALDSNYLPLPTGPADAVAIANLTVRQFHGNMITRRPLQYTGASEDFNTATPGFTVIWNAAANRWEITVPVTAFSGFYLTSKLLAPVAVKMEYFRGARSGSVHILDWKVNCSSVSATLVLERSSDARNFKGIYSTNATAVRCLQPFSYTDASPLAGINYYRLKMTDADGMISYSGIVALMSDVKGFELVSISPNPVAEGKFKLNINSSESMSLMISITDMTGRIVLKKNIAVTAGFNSINMDISHLPGAVYRLTCSTADGKTRALQLLKE